MFNRSNPIGQVLGPVKTKFGALPKLAGLVICQAGRCTPCDSAIIPQGWHLFRVEYRTGFNESNDSFDEPLGDGPLVQSEGRTSEVTVPPLY